GARVRPRGAPGPWRRGPASPPPLGRPGGSPSVAGHGGRGREGVDGARAVARGGRGGRGGVIWRFGSRVRAYDSLPPADGATRLAPAPAAAAGRGGPVSVVTDGAIDGLAGVPPDLLSRARVVVPPRASFRDAVIASVAGPSPPDWDSRFLARALSDVARVPVRTFVEAEPDGGGWRDAANLTPVSTAEVRRVVAGARLVVRAGNPAPLDRFASTGAILTWSTTRGQEGDWYVQPPGPSPLADALAGIAWDSLAPAAAVSDLALPSDSAAVVVLTARLARRGNPRPVIVLSERDGAGWTGGGARRATVAAAGLFRWAFRGGASAEAYRAVVAALADW